ncbi:MAG TPA: PEP-CTERM sorting domain-containing protein [Myxococcota bacterium]|nr:PEP-CTERM sorting domain-containing protein [Myxococcota bacterium]
MRKSVSGLMLGATVALLAPVAAHAGALVPGSSTLSLTVAGTVVSFPANAGGTGNASTNLAATVGASAFGPGKVTVKPNNTATIKKIIVSIGKNGAGSFSGTAPSKVHGNALITGLAKLKGAVNLSLPLAIGKAGTRTAHVSGTGGTLLLGISAVGASWEAGVAKITGGGKATPKGKKTVTVAGTNKLTAMGGGTLTLVSPGKVFTTIGADAFIPSPAFMTLTFSAVPEPGTLLLLGSGIAGLVLVGRKRAS